jgi:hypothetical protein
MTVVEAMAAFRAGSATEDATFRAIVGHDGWRVPTDAAGHPALWTVAGGPYIAAQVDEQSPDGQPYQWMRMRGAHLARHVPTDVAGVVFEHGRPHALIVESASTGVVLRRWALALDLEEALATPGPEQAPALLEPDWLVLHQDGVPAVDVAGDLRVVHAFTAPDQLKLFFGREPSFRQREVHLVRGSTLFAALSTRSDFDAVLVNRRADGGELLPPAVVHGLVEGRDLRVGTRPLAARTTAEIHLFLDLAGLAVDARTHLMIHVGAELVARYEGRVAGGTGSYDFLPVTPSEDPLDLGDGPTRILCAGALAEVFRRRMALLPDDPAKADPADRRQAAQAARWGFELEKLLPAGADRIPRAELRTANGARWSRERPFLLEREWLGKARRWAEALAGTV